MTTILLILILAPVVMLTVKHFWASRKPGKPKVHAFPFPILNHGKFYEPPVFRPVDYSQAPRQTQYDWH